MSVNLGKQGGGSDSVSLIRDVEKGCEVLFCFSEAYWWTWTKGSSLVFWRWPQDIQSFCKNSYHAWITSQLPKWPMPRKQVSKELYPLFLEKLGGFVHKNYVIPAKQVRSYMDVLVVS